MRLLLDTHVVIWVADRPEMLTSAERRLLSESGELALSVVSLWEIRLKWMRRHGSGDRKLSVDPARLLNWARDNGLTILDLSPSVAIATLDPPLAHSDPFDELLLTHAQHGGYRPLTRDAALASHPVALVAR